MWKLILLLTLFAGFAAAQCTLGYDPLLRRVTCPPGGSAGAAGAAGATGAGATPSYTTVAYSATPTFTVTTLTNLQAFKISLTGNVTSSTLVTTAAQQGQDISFEICQDATGSRTFVWPTNVLDAGVLDPTASACTRQSFRWDGTNAIGFTNGRSTSTTPGIRTSAGLLAFPTAPDTLVGFGGNNAYTSAAVNDARSAAHTLPAKTGTLAAIPATCTVGEQYFATNATAGQNAYYCTATDTWTQGAGGGSGTGVGRTSLTATWTAIADGGIQDKTATWTGVTTADTVTLGPPSGFTAGLSAIAWVSAADTVTIRIANGSGGSLTPGALTFKGTLAVFNLSATCVKDFGSIADGGYLTSTCAVTGVAAGDPVVPKWPAALEAGLHGSMVSTATDVVTITLQNDSGAALNPASATFGASVAK